MGTLLNRTNYNQLRQARDSLSQQFGADKIAGIHLPWAGDQLLTPTDGQRVIYMVGFATDKNYACDVPQNFEASLANLEEEFREHPKERANTPFWRFLSGLTKHFFEKPHYECILRWGWSNLFKIAYNEDRDVNWPEDLFQRQRAACVSALNSEFRRLRNTLIFIGAGKDRGLVREALSRASFDTIYENDGVHYWSDQDNGNVYVWGYHPSHAQQKPLFDQMLQRTIWLAER
jgi:hypothetical protein